MRNMSKMMSLSVISAAMLSGCFEPQPAPELTQRPSTDFKIDIIADGLDTPWSVAELPGGAFLVTERGGKLVHIGADGSKIEITGLPKDIYVEQQAGLFDVVLSPDFEQNGELFLSYAYGNADDNGTAVFRASLTGTALSNGDTIFRASPGKDTAQHFGGRIAFMSDGSLVLTGGDGFVYREKAQDLNSPLGKTFRLTPDGKAAPDNPFAGHEGAQPEIYTYGNRNVQGLHFDAQTGNLWAHEHGPRGGDELNLLTSGANYGWPLATTGTDYNGAKVTPFKTREQTTAFVKDWVPSIAPSGLTIYRGDLFPDWNGDALVGGLASHDVRRVDLEGGKAVGEESLLADLDGRIRDIRTDSTGAVLVVIEDSEDGRILRVSPK